MSFDEFYGNMVQGWVEYAGVDQTFEEGENAVSPSPEGEITNSAVNSFYFLVSEY